MKHFQIYLLLLVGHRLVLSQSSGPPEAPLANTPQTPYGVDWQTYFRVNDPHIPVPDLPRIYSGSVSVNRTGHANNTLFFLGFEKEEGSLTAGDGGRVDQPWMIYIAGGPGSAASAMPYGATGPVLLRPDSNNTQFSQNPYAWNNLVDVFYVDQPVGVGFSTVDPTGYIADEDQMGEDFVNFLRNLVTIFPSLKTRPLYLLGESYGGVFVPYIAKAIFAQASAPVNLVKLILGEAAVGSFDVYAHYSMLGVLQTYPQLVDFDSSTYEYFVEQYNLCGYNMTLQYPAPSPYPTITNPYTNATTCKRSVKREEILAVHQELSKLATILEHLSEKGTIELGHTQLAKRQSSDSPHLAPIGRINPDWECSVMYDLLYHASTTLAPWKDFSNRTTALAPIVNALFNSIKDWSFPDSTGYFNDPSVQAAYHAPNKFWRDFLRYPFNGTYCYGGAMPASDPSVKPQAFLSDLASKVPIIFFAASGDANVGHRGIELTIQNTTFGGIRGFTKRPSTPFSDGDGNFAGIIHSERNVTYALFKESGHIAAYFKPNTMYTFLREFVLGTNQTGYFDPDASSVVGGVHTEYLKGILTGSAVYTGIGTTQGTYTWPESKWNAWNSYMATRTAADVPMVTETGNEVRGEARRLGLPSIFTICLSTFGILALMQ